MKFSVLLAFAFASSMAFSDTPVFNTMDAGQSILGGWAQVTPTVWRAQAFHSASADSVLNHIEIALGSKNSRMSIYTDFEGRPGSLVGILGPGTPFRAIDLQYESYRFDGNGIELQGGGTRYWAVLSNEGYWWQTKTLTAPPSFEPGYDPDFAVSRNTGATWEVYKPDWLNVAYPHMMRVTVDAAPEPGTWAALGIGVLAVLRRRKRA